MKIQTSKFSLGQTFMTPGSMEELHPEDVMRSLRRHSFGDWGDCCADDRDANELALLDGSRIFSVYHDRFGKKFWVITEADRASTTILLPSEY
jgi:hypothetical protein